MLTFIHFKRLVYLLVQNSITNQIVKLKLSILWQNSSLSMTLEHNFVNLLNRLLTRELIRQLDWDKIIRLCLFDGSIYIYLIGVAVTMFVGDCYQVTIWS